MSDEAENVCEHGDHPAPPGKRFCSRACWECEAAECDHTVQECAGLCLAGAIEKGGPES